MKNVPDLFGDAADDEEAIGRVEEVVKSGDGKTHGSVHVVNGV